MPTHDELGIDRPPTRNEKRGPGRPPKNPPAAEANEHAHAIADASARLAAAQALREAVPQREMDMRAELARSLEEPRLVRRRKSSENPFDLPQHIIDDARARGMCMEWKRNTCFGQPDIRHMVALRENHWTPVEARRYPELMPPDKQEGHIEYDGMWLMERPDYLTKEAQDEDYQNAREAVKIKEDQMGRTPAGTLTRSHGGARPQIRKSWEPMTVPKE
jgi:hypothetical protein